MLAIPSCTDNETIMPYSRVVSPFGRRLVQLLLAASICLCGNTPGTTAAASDSQRPNFLWITSEDNSPYLGCYGDPQAQTRHLDRLAEQGVRYRNAFANAPVCSTSRTTLITGMYACSLGAEHHRSKVTIPHAFPLYPEVFRAAGYFCSNNSKTDYNLSDRPSPWDENGNMAHYRHRAANQSFFAVFNFTLTHESQVAPPADKPDTAFRIAPSKIVLPPYHPDTPEIRRDWANYYDQITKLDERVGAVLRELDEAGLADDTIVFYYSDHGGALPGGKRNIHDLGTRVPLIIRIPSKWQKWAPAAAGEWCDELVSFVDFPATVMSLAGLEVPANSQGRPFLGPLRTTPREQVFQFRGRMDERYDMVRALRTSRYRYVRNFNPELPWGQQYSYPFQVQPSMRSWYAEYVAGRCNPVQSRYWQPKPAEELYDLQQDPGELTNLADDPAHSELLAEFRERLLQEMLAIRDTGLVPEGMFSRLLSDRETRYEWAHSAKYPLDDLLPWVFRAHQDHATDPEFWLASTMSDDPVRRYWGAVAWSMQARRDRTIAERGRIWLTDTDPSVRIVAAEAWAQHVEAAEGVQVLLDVVQSASRYEQLAALNALDRRFPELPPSEQLRVREALKNMQVEEPLNRIVRRMQTESAVPGESSR